MLQPWSHVFATPGRRLRCFIFFLYCPILGRPTIVDVRIRSRIVRIHRARRTIRVVRVVPKTESRFSKPVFQPCSGQIQRSLSQWRTCLLHMDFYFKLPSRQGSVCEKTDHNTFGGRFGRAIASHFILGGGCTPVALACSLLHHSHKRTWADPPSRTPAYAAGLYAYIERGAQLELYALHRKRRAAL